MRLQDAAAPSGAGPLQGGGAEVDPKGLDQRAARGAWHNTARLTRRFVAHPVNGENIQAQRID